MMIGNLLVALGHCFSNPGGGGGCIVRKPGVSEGMVRVSYTTYTSDHGYRVRYKAELVKA